MGGGRRIGRVRLVEVEEGEEAPAAAGLHPPRQGFDADRAVALLVGHRLRGAVGVDGVVVRVEAIGDPRRAPQHVRGDRRSGLQPGRVEPGGERAPGSVEPEAQVVADAVVGRDEPGQHGRVGGQRQRAVAVDVLEEDAFPRQGVDRGRGAGRVSVGWQMVGAQRVDRDQHHGRVAKRAEISPAPAGGGEQKGRRGAAARQSPGRSHVRTLAMSRASRAGGAAFR